MDAMAAILQFTALGRAYRRGRDARPTGSGRCAGRSGSSGAMIEKDGRYLITQRPPTASLPLLWEFPAAASSRARPTRRALARELREEMGIEVEVGGSRRSTSSTRTTRYDIDFCVYRCRLVSGPIRHVRVHAHRWVRPEELDQYEFPPADEKSIAKLLGPRSRRPRAGLPGPPAAGPRALGRGPLRPAAAIARPPAVHRLLGKGAGGCVPADEGRARDSAASGGASGRAFRSRRRRRGWSSSRWRSSCSARSRTSASGAFRTPSSRRWCARARSSGS